MESLVNFKIFLSVEPLVKSKANVQALEVRRFSSPSPLTYAAFCETLETFLPDLKGSVYSVHWMDEDGDLIRVASDVEMLHAIHLMHGQSFVVKFYVVPKPAAPLSVHPGVQCDSCEVTPITGPRYKCTVCVDYDLCQVCEHRGVHNHHNVIRFVEPVSPFFSTKIHYRHSKKPCKKKCTSSESSDSEDGCPVPCKNKRERRHDHGKHRDEDREKHRHHRHGRHHFDHRGAKKLFDATANTAMMLADPQVLGQILNMGSSALKSVYAGVNSAVASTQANPSTTATESATAPTAPTNIQTGENPNPAPAEATTTASAVTPPESASASASARKIPQTDALLNILQTAMQNLDPVSQISDRLAQNRIDQVAPDWTIVNAEAGPSSQKSRENSYPDLRVQKGLELLESMGFDNSTGNVTRVLETFNGDLYKTLDALIPKRK